MKRNHIRKDFTIILFLNFLLKLKCSNKNIDFIDPVGTDKLKHLLPIFMYMLAKI